MSSFIPPTIAAADRPLGILASQPAARLNVLSIIPGFAHRQPIVSGRTGPARWYMVEAA